MLYATDQPDEFNGRARYVILFATGVVLVLSFVWIARAILLLLFAAVLCALLLSTVTDGVRKQIKLPRGVVLVTVVLTSFGLLALGVWLRGSEFAEQFNKLQVDLPIAAHKLVIEFQGTGWGQWLLDRVSDNAEQIGGVTFAVARIGGVVLTTATGVAALIIISIATLYFAVEPGIYLKGLRLITPIRYQSTLERCITSVAIQLRWWLLAKVVSMVAVGLLIFIGLRLLGTPLAGTLGMIAALLTFIPNIGPILSAAPAVLLSIAISPTKGLLTILLFFLVHFIEGNFVTPLAERGIVKLPPGLTLAVQLFLGFTTGALGIALAAPLTAALMAIAQVLLSRESRQAIEQLPALHSSAS